jgi:hypothetical protein
MPDLSYLRIFMIRVAQHMDLLVDVILRHDFIGAGRDGWINHGKLRNPDHPDQPCMNLEGASAQIRNNRNPYRRNRQVAFLPACMSEPRAACMSTAGRIHGEFLPRRILFFFANKQTDKVADVGIRYEIWQYLMVRVRVSEGTSAGPVRVSRAKSDSPQPKRLR